MSSGLAKSEVIAFASEVIALASAALFFAADTPVKQTGRRERPPKISQLESAIVEGWMPGWREKLR